MKKKKVKKRLRPLDMLKHDMERLFEIQQDLAEQIVGLQTQFSTTQTQLRTVEEIGGRLRHFTRAVDAAAASLKGEDTD